MTKTVWFDMDGTIANLYGVEGWLDYLQAENTTPYREAETLLNFSQLAKLLRRTQARGWALGIISWTSKAGSDLYNGQVALEKMVWLHKHLPSVQWDIIHIVEYGTPKESFMITDNDILFDDEERNRATWTGEAHRPDEIIDVLKQLIHSA